jgi:hypothetical protein
MFQNQEREKEVTVPRKEDAKLVQNAKRAKKQEWKKLDSSKKQTQSMANEDVRVMQKRCGFA